ncbi:MAG TPA: winged helix DNA-binding domain-containing protein [Solirubrobacteraceae bacterium]|nr:winged helix DNA-binding domain-containing protein [Solirubrobacteraceae bacterium]
MLAQRLAAQMLSGPRARAPVAVCERLLAVQGQDPRGFRLAVRARSEGLTAADVDRALDERALLVTWLNRGTLHLVRAEDYPWLHALTAPRHRTAIMRRLAQEGVADPDRGVAAIERALAADGPLPREELRERVAAAGQRSEGQALIHLLALASLRGLVVRGPTDGRQHLYALVRDWLGEQPRLDGDAALAELARRYLAGHGPAGDRDLAKWAGVTLRDAGAGLRAIAGALVERGGGLVDLARRDAAHDPATAGPSAAGARPRGARATSRAAGAPSRGADPPLPPPRLLGAFEPVLLGWASRDDVVGPHRDRITVEGLFRSFAMVGGRAVATWRLDGGDLAIEPLEPIAPADAAALDDDAADVRRFLGV